MVNIELLLEPWRRCGDTLELSGCLRRGESQHRLWWRVPAQWEEAITPWADPFVVGFIFPMMQWGGEVMVEGAVSPSLLENMEILNAIWRSWRPEKYKSINIHARQEIEMPAPPAPHETIIPFSCGVDSSYTLFRHRKNLVGRRTRHIGAGVVMQGFDIWLDERNADTMYAGLQMGAKKMLTSLGVPCISISSNFHELPMTWGDCFGTHLAGGLMLFAKRFSGALIPNDSPYTSWDGPWGSTPLINQYLGSNNFQLLDDGGEASRIDKIEMIRQWPAALENLRVCFSNPGNFTNCGKCEKCIRTILAFRITGTPLPAVFPTDVNNRQIRRVKFLILPQRQYWRDLISGLDKRGLGHTDWAAAMRAAVKRRQRWKVLLKPFVPLRNHIRRIFRGSALSRAQIAQLSTTSANKPLP